ncbi:TPA: tryptophan synthase subunit alpha, partial [Candidatus Bipolaricaulota bacterium]|nr:tryptophan synthase subunit alpha [Candidatus Bipolaricaulota bacterium]
MGIARIAERFRQLRERGEGVLIAYLMAGDPTPSKSLEYMHAVVEGGADLIELGIPFSDPVADGPTIQAAGQRALRSGTTPERV